MSDPQDPPRPPRAGPVVDDGLDAPAPRRMLAERSGSWKAARARHHPAVASLGLEGNLRAYPVESDTEETPPTAAPGMFRFDDLDDPDAVPAPLPAPPPVRVPEPRPDDDGFAALEAAIAAERAAVQGDVAPAPVRDVVADVVAEPGVVPERPVAPVVAPPAPAPRGVPWLPVLAGLAVVVGLAAWLLG